MRSNILIVGVLSGLVAAGLAVGFFWPIAADSRAAFCAALAAGSDWMREQCLRAEEVGDMLQQAESFCNGNSEYQHCLDAQKKALVQIVRTSENHPLEANQKL